MGTQWSFKDGWTIEVPDDAERTIVDRSERSDSLLRPLVDRFLKSSF